LATPAATVPTPISETSFTEMRASGFPYEESVLLFATQCWESQFS